MTDLKGKTVFITGGTRGIGRSIGMRMAESGANIVIAAKTKDPHPRLHGTLGSVVEEIESLGVKALGLQVDVRFDEQIKAAMDEAYNHFGSIDILINNASAIQLTDTENTDMKKFDLMFSVNVRATFAASKYAAEYMKKDNRGGKILMLSPPMSMDKRWFKGHCAYTMSKYGMSMCVLAMAEEFKPYGIAVNALWPKTTIATAAVNMLGGDRLMESSRKPEIVSDAAFFILTKDIDVTGNFFIDENVIIDNGITDLDKYSVTAGAKLTPDFFID